MNFQTSKRIMCCLMAALILCCAIVRPIEASATAILPALPTLTGISSGQAICGALAALGIGIAAGSSVDYRDLVDRIEAALPAEHIIATSTDNVDLVPVVTYEDITYISQSLVEFVQKYIFEPTDDTSPTVKATGYELTSTFQDIYDEAIALNPDYASIANAYNYCYTYTTGNTGTIIYTDKPVTYENNDDGSSVVKTNGGFLRLRKNGTSSVIDTYAPDKTGITTGTANTHILDFGLAAMTGIATTIAVNIIGNLAPDLTDDEEYQSWLERQKFFVVDPGNNGDDDNNNQEEPKPQPYLPIRLLEKLLETGSQSQEEAQSGSDPTANGQPQPEFTPLPDAVVDPADDPATSGGDAVDPGINGSEDGGTVNGWLKLIYEALCNIMLNIIVQIEQLNTLPDRIANAIEWVYGNIETWIEEQTKRIESALLAIRTYLYDIKQLLVSLPTQIKEFFENLGARIETAFQWIWEHLAAAFETLGSIITTAFEWIWQHLATAFQNVIDTLNTFWQNLKNWMQTMADYLLNGLRSLFIPDKDYISDKVKSLRNRFAWIDPIMAYFDGFAFDGSEPPIIYIHLDDAEGSYYWGETIPFLDMRWYSRYKATGDLILSGFLWALFAWRMYLKLPGTISGMSGAIGRIGE